jgi:hypothetical protein
VSREARWFVHAGPVTRIEGTTRTVAAIRGGDVKPEIQLEAHGMMEPGPLQTVKPSAESLKIESITMKFASRLPGVRDSYQKT